MTAQDLLSLDYRKARLDEIMGDENKKRKAESYRRSEIFNKRAEPYINARLEKEFPKSWKSMRKIMSINPAERIVTKKASVYNTEPNRSPVGPKGITLSDEQIAFIADTYSQGRITESLKESNRFKKFQHQYFIQVIPFRGVIKARVYQPHQIDVIPDDNDPETAACYIVSAYDRAASVSVGDGQNQKIADANDGSNNDGRAKMRFVWWSNELNFITDGNGLIVSGDEVINPVGRHCFIDGAEQKENEFFVRKGSSVCDFAVDLAVVLSDIATTNRAQSFAQMVLISDEPASDLEVGVENAIRLPLAKEGGGQPDVKFVAPNADLDGSISFLSTLLSLFLTAEGEDPKTLNTQGNAVAYTSGLDRFLAQLEQFEASRQDFEHYERVEAEIFELVCLWANHFAGATNSPLTKVPAITLPQDAYMTVKFSEPQIHQSPADQEKELFDLLDKGIISKIMLVMQKYNFDEGQALEHLKKVAADQKLIAEQVEPDQKAETETEEVDTEDTIEEASA